MVDVIQELGHLENSDYRQGYAGKPDAAMSCPSGLEGAGRKRTSAMMQRAALLPYTARL